MLSLFALITYIKSSWIKIKFFPCCKPQIVHENNFP